MAHNIRHCPQKNTRKGFLFFRIIIQDTIQQKQPVSLPVKFVRKYEDQLSNVANLLLPNGHNWKLELRKEKESIFLGDGLSEFFKYFSICDGSLLLFEYKGTSNFNVHIMDKSCCEIEYPCHFVPKDHEGASGGTKKRTLLPDFENEIQEQEPYLSNQNLPDSHKNATPAKKRKRQEENQGKVKTPKMQELGKKRKSETQFDEVGMTSEEPRIYSSNRLKSTLRRLPLQSKEAVEELKTTKSQNPCFLVLVLENNLRHNVMNVPAPFARRYLRRANEDEIKVEGCGGREWEIHSRWTWRGGNLWLSNGWAKFFDNNRLKVGDVCLFELIQTNNIILKATLRRI